MAECTSHSIPDKLPVRMFMCDSMSRPFLLHVTYIPVGSIFTIQCIIATFSEQSYCENFRNMTVYMCISVLFLKL
jgi:hypothetical protein